MSKKIFLIMIIIFLMSGNVYGNELNLSGHSYILMDAESGRVLLEHNSHEKRPMASTTKIMTALLGIEYGNLKEKVKITKESQGIEGSSIYLMEGEEIELEDLLYGLLLQSGNDSANAIAKHIGGSEKAFVELMNKRARALGAFNTGFANPHGLDGEGHYTTAYDLALITREAFKYDIFRDINSSKGYTGERDRHNYYKNKNKILWDYEGGDGGKTGYTFGAGRCLVSSATRDGMRLIAVSLSAPNWFNDNYSLLDYGYENYVLKTIYEKDQLIAQADVINGTKKRAALVSETGFKYPLTDEEEDGIKIVINTEKSIKAPVKRGEKLGEILIYFDGRIIGKDNLVSKYEITEPTFLNKLLNRFTPGA